MWYMLWKLFIFVPIWAHEPGMPGTFSPPPRVSDPDMHHGTCVTHVPWCMPGSLTRGFVWSRWQGKRSRHSQRMRNPQFYVSGKRPIGDKPLSELMVTHFTHVCAPLGLGVRLGILTNVLFGTTTDKVLQHIPKVFLCASLVKSLDHFSYLLLQVL